MARRKAIRYSLRLYAADGSSAPAPAALKIHFQNHDWEMIGKDDIKRLVLISRHAAPGEQPISPSGIPMPFLVWTLNRDEAWDAARLRWHIIL